MKRYAKEIFFPENNGVEPEFVAGGHTSTPAKLSCPDYLAETGEQLLSPAQQRALEKLIREDDAVTKRQLIAHNLLQVIHIARRYTNRGLGFLDLVREGTEGLIQALRRYEPVGGSCFSTFATVCVCQHINLAILNQKSPRRTFHAAACF